MLLPPRESNLNVQRCNLHTLPIECPASDFADQYRFVNDRTFTAGPRGSLAKPWDKPLVMRFSVDSLTSTPRDISLLRRPQPATNILLTKTSGAKNEKSNGEQYIPAAHSSISLVDVVPTTKTDEILQTKI